MTNYTHKMCYGPLHDEPTMLPLTDFYLRNKKNPAQGYAQYCRYCRHYEMMLSVGYGKIQGFVKRDDVWWIFEEIVRKIGIMEACRRLEMSQQTMWAIRHGVSRRKNAPGVRTKKKWVKAEIAQRAILLLKELRDNHEVISRRSIKLGAAMRGKEVKPPEGKFDYEVPTGDNDVEKRRARRQAQEARERAS